MNQLITYRCGYCGTPTDEKGKCIDFNLILDIKQYDNAVSTDGECCLNEVYNEMSVWNNYEEYYD